jgi:hypothetical protein
METFYKVQNPLHEDITIMVKGVNYTLPADGELANIPEFVKTHWVSLHGFLHFSKMPKVIVEVEEVIDTPIDTPIVEEVMDMGGADFAPAEEILEEVKEETPVVIEEEVKVVAKKGKKK